MILHSLLLLLLLATSRSSASEYQCWLNPSLSLIECKGDVPIERGNIITMTQATPLKIVQHTKPQFQDVTLWHIQANESRPDEYYGLKWLHEKILTDASGLVKQLTIVFDLPTIFELSFQYLSPGSISSAFSCNASYFDHCKSGSVNKCLQTCNGNPACPGIIIENRKCSSFQEHAVVDGSWSAWSEWSPCSVSCGPGAKIRDRSCNNPAPENGGLPCSGDETESSTCDERCGTLTVLEHNLDLNSSLTWPCGYDEKKSLKEYFAEFLEEVAILTLVVAFSLTVVAGQLLIYAWIYKNGYYGSHAKKYDLLKTRETKEMPDPENASVCRHYCSPEFPQKPANQSTDESLVSSSSKISPFDESTRKWLFSGSPKKKESPNLREDPSNFKTSRTKEFLKRRPPGDLPPTPLAMTLKEPVRSDHIYASIESLSIEKLETRTCNISNRCDKPDNSLTGKSDSPAVLKKDIMNIPKRTNLSRAASSRSSAHGP